MNTPINPYRRDPAPRQTWGALPRSFQKQISLLGNFRPFALEDTRRARRNAAIAMGANPKLSRSTPPLAQLALARYAKQRNDSEPDRWMSEIRLRAIAQIGKISRELDKAKRGGVGGTRIPPVGTLSKQQQLADAEQTAANRYEQLATPEELKPILKRPQRGVPSQWGEAKTTDGPFKTALASRQHEDWLLLCFPQRQRLHISWLGKTRHRVSVCRSCTVPRCIPRSHWNNVSVSHSPRLPHPSHFPRRHDRSTVLDFDQRKSEGAIVDSD